MNIKRHLRGPLFWVSLAVLLVIIGSQVWSSAGAAKKVDTSQIVSEINKGELKSAKLVDKDQRIEVTLKAGGKQRASYITGQGVDLQSALQKQVDAGNLPDGYNVSVPKQNTTPGTIEIQNMLRQATSSA